MQDQICPTFDDDDDGVMACYYADDSNESYLDIDLYRARERFEEAEKEYLYAKKHFLEAERRLNNWRLNNLKFDLGRIEKL